MIDPTMGLAVLVLVIVAMLAIDLVARGLRRRQRAAPPPSRRRMARYVGRAPSRTVLDERRRRQ